jgi:succinyl-CoA synthetase beta subunit
MNIHEYQGKEILASYGVRIQRGIVANNAVEAVAAAKQLTAETGTGWHVIKAQVHAGGRGKGGGVKLAKNLDQVNEIAGSTSSVKIKCGVCSATSSISIPPSVEYMIILRPVPLFKSTET